MADVVFSIVTTLIIVFGITYMIGFSVVGIVQSRKQGVRMSKQELQIDDVVDDDADLLGLAFYVLIPAMNEERVIGGTIQAVLDGQPGVTVVVVDDGSDDRTPLIVDSFAGTGRVLRHTRVKPEAQRGKGQALNDALRMVRADVERRRLRRSRVIIGVLDADGRMTANATTAVARHFAADRSIGGVQLGVRIRNHADSLTLMFQDMSFWGICALMQIGRTAVGSTAMGGNGQFTRLSALDEVGDQPWSDSLTEDLDLGLSLSILGWRSVGAAGGYVTQQGVNSFRRLVRQHTRWFQGHMMCIARFPELARSRYLPTARFLELTSYLLVPWVLVLPWSIIQQYILFQLATGGLDVRTEGLAAWQRVVMWLLWYVVSFAPQLYWGVVYFRRTSTYSFGRAMLMAHLMLPWSYFGFICVWRALFRIVLHRNGWAKTTREVEDDIEVAEAIEVEGRQYAS